jgi:hypothetical protein
MTRFGMTGNISPESINNFIALKGEIFIENANLNLIKSDFKQKINEAESLGFKLKGTSKKNNQYVNDIESKREKNYLGKWYRDGWFSQKKLADGDFSFSYTDNIFYERDNLPYTDSKSTGLYIDEIWSGYNTNFDSSKYVIGGFINANIFTSGEEKRPFPYKNFNEIFDHSGVQIGDMGGNIAYSAQELSGYETPTGQILGYATGETIGYNKIFFLSGLNRQNINNYDYRVLLIPNKSQYNKRKNITSASKILGKIEEEPDRPRYNVFFYTGNLNAQYTPTLNFTPNTLGWGDLYATNITGSLYNINSGFNIKCSGIYPQFFIKDFYVYNTGSVTQKFYFGNSNTGMIEITPDIPSYNTDYQWTSEQNKIFSGQKINLFSMGKNSVSYFKVKIDTKNITGSINNNSISMNEYIYMYRATGEILGSNFSGLKSQVFSVPLTLNINFNNAQIFSDDYFYDMGASGSYRPYSLKNQIVRFDHSGIINKNNKFFGLTLYATGGILESGFVKDDLNKKINKLAEYSSTGIFKDIKTIYPLKEAETYYSVDSDASWLKNLNSSTQIFRWTSGFSGFFTGINFNPISGAIQQDLRLVIDTSSMLPQKANTNGSNFTVKFQNGNILFNNVGSGSGFNFVRGKKYRFLQINSGNSHSFKINSNQARTFEPEYSKAVLNNYKLIEFSPNANTPNLVSWSAGGAQYSGNFLIHGGQEEAIKYKADVNLTGQINEYNVIAFTYETKKYPMHYMRPGKIKTPVITGYKLFAEDPKYTVDNTGYKLMQNLNLEKNRYYAFVNTFNLSNTDSANSLGLGFWTGSRAYIENNLYYFNEYRTFYTISGQSRYNIYTFKVPTSFPSGVNLYLGITGGHQPLGLPVNIINSDIFNERTGNYSELTNPVFSGNLNVYTSNINSNFKLPVILSGISNIDYIAF